MGERPGGSHEARGEDDVRFPRSHRLRRREEFLRVQRTGRRVHTRHYVVVVLPRAEDDGLQRIGITVTKKVAGSVGRNRTKRVLREVFRQNRHFFPESCDVVVIAKSGAHLLGYEEAREELARIRRPMASSASKARRAAEARPAEEGAAEKGAAERASQERARR